MSVRSKIEQFEAISRDQSGGEESRDGTGRRSSKRFKFPGKTTDTDIQDPVANFINSSRSPKADGFQDFEADLKEVWSVRKNIHHTGGPAQQIVSSSNSSTGLGAQAKKGLYSRHGAIPSQSIKSTWGSMTQVQGTAKDSFGRGSKHLSGGEDHGQEHKRMPLQDYNSKESPWNVKKAGYSYNVPTAAADGMSKRPIGSPKASEPSMLPAAKRRINYGGMDVVKPTTDHRAPQLRGTTETPSDKVNYAKKMAEGYLKSMGMGEFTPKTDMYSRQEKTTSDSSKVTKWKRLDDDDQEFEFDI